MQPLHADGIAQLDEPEWTFGDRLRKARLHAGLSAHEAAVRLGVSVPAISKWERDAGRPRDVIRLAKSWSDMTGVRVEWLLGLDPHYPRSALEDIESERASLPVVPFPFGLTRVARFSVPALLLAEAT